MTLFHHIFCWLVPPKSTEQVPPRFQKWPPVPPNTPRINKLLTDSAQVWNWFTKLPSVPAMFFRNCSSALVIAKLKFSMCWAEPFFSIKWIQLHTWAEPVKPDDKALLKSHSEFYNVVEYMTIGTGLICGWGLNSAPLIRIGVCLGLSGIYSLPVLFSRICPKAVSLFFSSPSGVS